MWIITGMVNCGQRGNPIMGIPMTLDFQCDGCNEWIDIPIKAKYYDHCGRRYVPCDLGRWVIFQFENENDLPKT